MSSPAPQLRLRVLAGMELTFDGESLALSQPGERVLAHLAVVQRRRPVRRTTLGERLWPEAPPGRATSHLRSVLWRLPRPRARTLVVGDATTVRLHPDVDVDLWRGEELASTICESTDPQPTSPAELEPLYDDLLPDWHDEWLLVEREAYRQQRLHALERLATLWCERGRFTEALAFGLGAVATEPLRESAHRRVIAVHLAEGNYAEALRQYDGYRRLVADELGLSPSQAIRSMMAPLLGRPVDR